MEAREYLKLATDNTEAGDLIRKNNLTEAIIKLMSNYAEFRLKNCSIPDVVGRSEQLLALAQYMCEHQNNLDGKTAKDYLQDFLSQ